MRFTTARLCGGKALMAISADIMDIDIGKAAEVLAAEGCTIKEKDDMVLVFEWEGKEVTLYPQGKVMYLPQTDREQCISDAAELLRKLRRSVPTLFYRSEPSRKQWMGSSDRRWLYFSPQHCAL